MSDSPGQGPHGNKYPPGWKKCECGCPILFKTNPETGKLIPLDLRSPCFYLDGDQALPATTTYVSHFCTCTKADKFSGRSRG